MSFLKDLRVYLKLLFQGGGVFETGQQFAEFEYFSCYG